MKCSGCTHQQHVSREALQETQIGHIVVPKGVCLWTLIPTLHRDPDIWGPNVNEFDPECFANGISNACKLPQVYIPFGVGPGLCLGKNFALDQLKILIANIISEFTFSLSPKYIHSPIYRMIVEPAQGVHLIIKKNPKELGLAISRQMYSAYFRSKRNLRRMQHLQFRIDFKKHVSAFPTYY